MISIAMVTVKLGNWSFGFGSRSAAGRKRPLALVILDGWGHSNKTTGNAIALAKTPNYDNICARYPKTLLAASGSRVGLLPESPGNSETGYLNLGMGRAVKCGRKRILEAINSGKFFENAILKNTFTKTRNRKSSVHLVGLISDGDVHSSLDSLFALLRMAKREGCGDRVFIHAILDGQDVLDHTADVYIEALQIKMAEIGCGKIASLCGRNYAMDSGGNWDRTARAFTMIVHSEGERTYDPVAAIRGSYLRGNSDASIAPVVIEKEAGVPVVSIKNGDSVIFFNHRGDGLRQLVRSMMFEKEGSAAQKPDLDLVCMTEYDKKFKIPAAFKSEPEINVLAEIFAHHGVANCRLAETEKYQHVTYFFNGGREIEHPGEKRILVPSANGSNGKNHPPACFTVTDKLLSSLEAGEDDVFVVNLAAADMIAHTGDLDKTIEAVQSVDKCLGEIVQKIHEVDGVALITSDHGNCEEMTNGNSRSDTSNPVPFHFVANDLNGLKLRADGALEDVAPTILGILGIEKPFEMTGNDLRIA
ncbi:MAG: 2,3-bisphosphoglycerate-independent phosphoglycerate mutase [Pyrinomonadaceae bacterium]